MPRNDDDIIEQRKKRLKSTKEMATENIASSIVEISKSIASMSETYSEMLKINKNVVSYLHEVEKHEKGINQTISDTEHTFTEKSNN